MLHSVLLEELAREPPRSEGPPEDVGKLPIEAADAHLLESEVVPEEVLHPLASRLELDCVDAVLDDKFDARLVNEHPAPEELLKLIDTGGHKASLCGLHDENVALVVRNNELAVLEEARTVKLADHLLKRLVIELELLLIRLPGKSERIDLQLELGEAVLAVAREPLELDFEDVCQ